VRKIDKIIVHCSATPKGKHFDVDEIRRWHVEGRGWTDIGYHYVIYLDGSIHKGRDLKIPGAHVRGHNKNSIGICYIGGVSNVKNKKGKWDAEDTRTTAQEVSLDVLIRMLMCSYDGATLHGHNEFSNKRCPSFIVEDEYKDIIEHFKK